MQTFSRLPGGQSVKQCIFPFAHRANGKEGLHMPIAGVANGIPHCKYRLLVVAGGQTEEHCAQCRLRGGKRYDALQIPFAVGQTGNARCKYRLLVGKRYLLTANAVCVVPLSAAQSPSTSSTGTASPTSCRFLNVFQFQNKPGEPTANGIRSLNIPFAPPQSAYAVCIYRLPTRKRFLHLRCRLLPPQSTYAMCDAV